MAKTPVQDSQILLNILKVQQEINESIENEGGVGCAAKDQTVYETTVFKLIKIESLSTNLSNATKKELEFLKSMKPVKTIVESLKTCYPTLAPRTVMEYAEEMSSEDKMSAIRLRYKECIEESDRYRGEN